MKKKMARGAKQKQKLLDILANSVLPGPEAASPPAIQQKYTAIWRKLTAISNFSKIPLLFSAIFGHFA
jgi:hypothetical protein